MDKDKKDEKGPIQWLKKFFSKKEHSDRKFGKYQYFLLVLIVGAAFMLISNLFMKQQPTSSDISVFNQNNQGSQDAAETFGSNSKNENKYISDYERAYEAALKDALDKMLGVEDVSVIVNVDGTEKNIMEKNTKTQSQTTNETDPQGGKRTVEDQSNEEQVVIIQNGEKEVPIVVEKKKPEIRGVLVVAKGADNIQVKKWIVEAVTRVLDVPSHRVAVMPKKSKGDS
ncbi:stage III sporulation protein AG [Bacillus sp. 03113]|uniref:stage III sporulation protein AG n=1 Tax=Bacillus sp. 03113 TaxID=2578211 RepID=UPI001141CCDD|nr:stage III sporulation protein AG [Bacillus sp. 03113]